MLAAEGGEGEACVAAEEQAQAIETQLIATVATSYYSLLMLDRQIEIARLNISQTLIDAGKEVNNALDAIATARERLTYAGEQNRLLQEAVAKTELLMRHSPTNYLEVLTAQQALLAAQQSQVQCRYDEIAGIITLYHALGGGR